MSRNVNILYECLLGRFVASISEVQQIPAGGGFEALAVSQGFSRLRELYLKLWVQDRNRVRAEHQCLKYTSNNSAAFTVAHVSEMEL